MKYFYRGLCTYRTGDWMRTEMRKRRKYQVYLVLVVLILSLAGCASGMQAEFSNGTNEASDARGAKRSADAGDAWKKPARHKGSDQSENQHWQNGEQAEAGEEPPQAVLAVTDHRVGSSMVREYADREAFLQEYGFDGQVPFFEYFLEDGALQMELFYEESSGTGCGVRYYPGGDREPEGFLFNGSGNLRYYKNFLANGEAESDPYSILAYDGSDGKDEAEDYEEYSLYREDGRPVHFDSRGWITYLTENREIQKLLEIDWSYREDGTLQEKDYRHNSMVFGTWYCSRQSYYDAGERLVHEHCSVTHGSVDFYYIYEQ